MDAIDRKILAELQGEGRLTSTIVMKRVVEDRPYPGPAV